MVRFTQLAPNVVQVTGMDLRLMPPARWHQLLVFMTDRMQRSIRARYENENTAQGRRFLPNTFKWNRYKERKGYAPNRGQMLRRIVRRLKYAKLGSVSAVTPAGTAVITFDELYLYVLEPHARWYARHKVPGGRILTVSRVDIRRGGQIVRESEALANERQLERLRRRMNSIRRPIEIQTQQGRQFGPRRQLTLALTAWRAVAQTSRKLALRGRI